MKRKKVVAEKLNGRLAMLGIIAGIGAYLTTGQINPGVLFNEIRASSAISPFQAILWCIYPVGTSILQVFLFLCLNSGDDDDDDEGGGVMTPVYQGA